MKQIIFIIFLNFAISPCLSAKSFDLSGSQAHIPNELLIKFIDRRVLNVQKPRILNLASAIAKKIRRFKVQKRNHIGHLGVEHWTLQTSSDLEKTLQQLSEDPDVLMVEPNYKRFPRVAHINENSPLNLSKIQLAQTNLDKLREITPTNVVKVAIFDDAFELTHEDLKDKVFMPRDSVADTDDPFPRTCEENDKLENHGTKVMGVLAAGVDNGIGVNGATDSTTKIIPIRLGCDYSVAAELDAIKWAIDNDANIINMSYGGPQYSIFENAAIEQLANKNILIVTAAGNNEISNDRTPDYPSSLDLPNIIAVAAADKTKQLAKWSQYGQTSVDLAAPGGLLKIGTTFLSNKYGRTTGTSFSAPIVSGLAASLLARHSDITVYDVKGALLSSVAPYDDIRSAKLASGGFVDVYAAHERLSAQFPIPVPIIKRIRIDDSKGNANGQVDPNEEIELVITLENIWGDADTMKLTLSSELKNMAPLEKTLAVGLMGFDKSNYTYNSIELRYPVDFDIRTQSQGLQFSLNIEGKYASSTLDYKYQRNFTVDTGSLSANGILQAILRKHDQDDAHYYSIYIEEPTKILKVTLEMVKQGDSSDNLNLLANRSRFPEYNLLTYESESYGSINSGTIVSANKDTQPENITFNDINAGETIFFIVTGNANTTSTDIVYKIISNTTVEQPKRTVIAGCSMGKLRNTSHNFEIDPTIPLIIIISIVMIRRHSDKTTTEN